MGWGANLGGQISTFVGSLTKERAASPGRAALSAGSQSRLRGLFLREGGPASTAAAGLPPPATSAGEALQNGNMSAGGAADVQDAGTSTLNTQNSCASQMTGAVAVPGSMQPAACSNSGAVVQIAITARPRGTFPAVILRPRSLHLHWAQLQLALIWQTAARFQSQMLLLLTQRCQSWPTAATLSRGVLE